MNLKQRFLLLLADPDVPISEHQEFEQWLVTGQWRDGQEGAKRMRSLLKDLRSEKPAPRATADPKQTGGPADEVSRLLRFEADLTVKEALELLAEALGRESTLPDKTAFFAGVRRLFGEYGEATVLSTAHRVRNQLVHRGSASSWSLRHGS